MCIRDRYTNKAFQGGTTARAVLENSMMDKIKTDLAVIDALMESGQSRQEALAGFLTDENFDAWYASFDKALRAAAQ